MKPSSRSLFAASNRLVLSFSLMACLPASADNGWWNTANGNWSNTANWWTTSVGPTEVTAVPTTGQTATFNGTGVSGNQTVYLDGNQAASSLTFNNTGTTTLLGGTSDTPATNTLSLSGGITVAAGAGAVTIGGTGAPVPITLGANQTWTNSSSNRIAIANPVSGGFTLTLSGNGGILLQGANIHTQNTTITGTVRVGVDSVGTTTAITSGPFGVSTGVAPTTGRLVLNGGTISSDGTTARSILNYLAFQNATNYGDPVLNGKLTFENGGTLGNAVRTLTTNSEVEIKGEITGTSPGGITKAGPSMLTLSGTSIYPGVTTINAGTLALGNGGNLGNTAVTVGGASTFAIRQNANGAANSIGTGTLTLNAGSFLNMADGFTTTFNLGGNAVLAPVTGARPTLTFNLAGSSSDTITATGAATAGAAGANIAISTPTAPVTPGNFTLVSGGAGSALATNIFLASPILPHGQGIYSLSLSSSTSGAVVLSLSQDPDALYWTGASDSTWTTAGNWNTSLDGGTASLTAPAAGSNLVFCTTTPVPANLANTLGADTTVNSVNFTNAAASVTIGAGNALTINSGGITSFSSNPQTINAPVTLGAAQTWTNNGTGLLTIGGAVTNTTRNLAVSGTGNTTLGGGFGNGSGTLAKSGTGTLTLSGLSATAGGNHSGTTTIDNGTVAITGTSPAFTGGLTFGSNTPATNVPNNPTTGTLDLGNASATFAGNLLARTTGSSANSILIGSGQVLTLNGNLSLGTSVQSPFFTTRLNISGSGQLLVDKAGGLVQVGNSTGANNNGVAILDMSGLATFTANLGTTGTLGTSGTFRVGATGSGNPASATTAILAGNSSITAAFLGIGDNEGNAGPISLLLGSGTQTLNANTILLGLNNASTQRANAVLRFNSASGSVKIRSATDPVDGAANLLMGQNASTTGGATTATFDVSAHSADIKLADLRMSARNAVSAQTNTDTFRFDTGTLSVANQALLATNTAATSTSSNVANMTLGGGSLGTGSVTFTSGLLLARNASTSGTGTATANLTINANTGFGFTVTSGPITMADTTGTTNAANSATATINLNGGSLTMTGNITAGGTGTGTATRTLNLAGGTLDMGNNSIGSGSAAITLNATAGTLRNLAELNGGGGLAKSGAGTLVLEGTNAYTGSTTVSSGTLLVNSPGGISGTGAVSVSGILGGTGSIAGPVTVETGGILAPGVSTGNLTSASAAFSASSTFAIQIDDTATPKADSLTTSGTLNLTGASLALTVTGSPAQPAYVIANYPTGLLTGTFTGLAQGAPVPGMTGYIIDYTHNSGTQIALVQSVAPAGFAAWIDDFGLAIADQDLADDPDNDGMENLLEFVLNGNPATPDTAKLPALNVTATDFEFTYQRRDDSLAPETSQTFEWGTTLAAWPGSITVPATSGTIGVAIVTVTPGVPSDSVTDTVKISIPRTEAGSASKLFGRLKVAKP